MTEGRTVRVLLDTWGRERHRNSRPDGGPSEHELGCFT